MGPGWSRHARLVRVRVRVSVREKVRVRVRVSVSVRARPRARAVLLLVRAKASQAMCACGQLTSGAQSIASYSGRLIRSRSNESCAPATLTLKRRLDGQRLRSRRLGPRLVSADCHRALSGTAAPPECGAPPKPTVPASLGRQGWRALALPRRRFDHAAAHAHGHRRLVLQQSGQLGHVHVAAPG